MLNSNTGLTQPTIMTRTVEEAGPQLAVVATRLKLRNWLQLRRFFKVNGEVERQLRAAPSLVSYRLKADFLRLRFSTLSVWETNEAIGVFVRCGRQNEAIAIFDEIAVREASGFVRRKTSTPDGVTWEKARQKLEEQ